MTIDDEINDLFEDFMGKLEARNNEEAEDETQDDYEDHQITDLSDDEFFDIMFNRIHDEQVITLDYLSEVEIRLESLRKENEELRKQLNCLNIKRNRSS